jgi:hypothetical protein
MREDFKYPYRVIPVRGIEGSKSLLLLDNFIYSYYVVHRILSLYSCITSICLIFV